ncbi:MAG: NADH-quinone oxidoreductase subunit L [Candidatus Delongbacteria bacterium]|nr:NADH-quinone oxidoreductase subunit L [Candidatus Delongbacteria bacterium]
MEHNALSSLLGWIPLFPLLGFLVNGLLGKRLPMKLSGTLASVAIGASFVTSVLVFMQFVQLEESARLISVSFFHWMHVGGLSLDWTLQLDPLSLVFALFVSGVATLIHIYSIGYMSEEKSYWRYFAYLNLFCFSMLMLVLGGNYLVMFLGWEGVGLCSYLLIGFWFTDMEKAIAGKKAFVVNRIGDFGFLVAMFLMFAHYGTLDFLPLFDAIGGEASGSWLPTAIALFLFIGATGKSAQIPLYVWLPDAMAGPTPVSALIHAATMVTAGVYMIGRSHVIYTLAPTALAVVATVGALTALFAASMGLAQNDIKKVLAYSTVSQLGYMFLGMGVGAYSAGLFHVVTHAFFKALLFLGSGAVIHAMHHVYHAVHDHHKDPQDMRNMGGLKSHLPITYWTFLIGTIAIAGFPPLSGFFSKDEILWKTWESGHTVLWLLGFCAAGLTSFYMFRLLFMTFHGKYRGTAQEASHFHENPLVMTVPLMVLAVLAAIAGFWGLPHFLDVAHVGNRFDEFLAPVFYSGSELHLRHAMAGHGNVAMEWLLAGLSVCVAIVGLLVARRLYLREDRKAASLVAQFPGLHRQLLNKWYVDELYQTIVIKPIGATCDFLWKYVDALIIDGAVNGLGSLCVAAGQGVRRLQGGRLSHYLALMAAGTAVLIGWVFYF